MRERLAAPFFVLFCSEKAAIARPQRKARDSVATSRHVEATSGTARNGVDPSALGRTDGKAE